MKQIYRFGWLTAISTAPLVLAGCSNSPDSPVEIASSEAPSATVASAVDPSKLAAFKDALRKEPKVIDLVYDPAAAVQWTVGVKDDGTPRYGYAAYICDLMDDYNLDRTSAVVRIVDYAKFMQPGGNGRDASLGSVNCKTGDQMMP